MLINILNNYLYNTDHNDINHLIAKFIKKNIDNIENMTIEELANACYVSKAKISKFCRSLGYDSFIAFKDDCSKEVENKLIVVETQKQGLDIGFHNHLHKSLRTIEDNLAKVDLYEINLLVKEIMEASYIFLFGMAYSNLLCRYIQYECDFLNKEVVVLDEKINKDYVMKEGALLIVLSVDGLGLEHDQRLFHKLIKYPVQKWIISTDVINQTLLYDFDHFITIPSVGTEVKDRQVLIRYLIDVIIGRFQYLNM